MSKARKLIFGLMIVLLQNTSDKAVFFKILEIGTKRGLNGNPCCKLIRIQTKFRTFCYIKKNFKNVLDTTAHF